MSQCVQGPRQIEPKGGSRIFPAGDIDISAGLLDEAEDHAQPQSGALALLLGREKRFEDAA